MKESAKSADAKPRADSGVYSVRDWSTGVSDDRRDYVAVAKPVANLDAGESALLAEEIELRALGEVAQLALTEREWTAFAGVTLCHQAIRHAYEAEVAVVTSLEGGHQRLEIPVYAEAGGALRSELYASLQRALGENVAGQVVRKLGRSLEGRFAGFGVAVQTLDFAGEAGGTTEPGSVTRTVVFWSERGEGGALMTRSETCFPQLEDPDGLQWGPLLARLEAAQGKKARG